MPIPVRDVDNPARERFQTKVNFSLTSGEPDKSAFFAVPAGKRLVIEHVSALAGVPEGQKVLLSVATFAPISETHVLVANEQGTFPQVFGFGMKAVFVASQTTRLYADPGTNVILAIVRNSTDGTAVADFVIAGHLVGIP